MLRTPVGRLRVIAFIEGVSYLVLLGVAMPLKYLAGMPAPVKAVGWAHGVLFVLYLLSVGEVYLKRRWTLMQAGWAVAAAFVPFGTFALDGRLRREERAEQGGRP
jgi:integral membrane protein